MNLMLLLGLKEGMDVGAGEVVGAGDDIVRGTETEVVEIKELWDQLSVWEPGLIKTSLDMRPSAAWHLLP